MIRAILFNGPPESGKDEAAKIFASLWSGNTVPLKFSAPLEGMLRRAVNDLHTPYEELKRKNFLHGSGRKVMIDSYLKVIAPILGEEWLGEVAGKKAVEEEDLLLITDAGRNCEILKFMEFVPPKLCHVVKITRPGKTFAGDSREPATHPLAGHNHFLENDGGLNDLYIKVAALAHSLEATRWL